MSKVNRSDLYRVRHSIDLSEPEYAKSYITNLAYWYSDESYVAVELIKLAQRTIDRMSKRASEFKLALDTTTASHEYQKRASEHLNWYTKTIRELHAVQDWLRDNYDTTLPKKERAMTSKQLLDALRNNEQ